MSLISPLLDAESFNKNAGKCCPMRKQILHMKPSGKTVISIHSPIKISSFLAKTRKASHATSIQQVSGIVHWALFLWNKSSKKYYLRNILLPPYTTDILSYRKFELSFHKWQQLLDGNILDPENLKQKSLLNNIQKTKVRTQIFKINYVS